jgi:hypothetical protein
MDTMELQEKEVNRNLNASQFAWFTRLNLSLEDYIEAGLEYEFENDQALLNRKVVQIGDVPVAVLKHKDRYYAIQEVYHVQFTASCNSSWIRLTVVCRCVLTSKALCRRVALSVCSPGSHC